jgi:hypothetical protein
MLRIQGLDPERYHVRGVQAATITCGRHDRAAVPVRAHETLVRIDITRWPVWGTVRPYVHWERPQSVKGSYDTVKSRCLCLLACRAAVLALPQRWAVVFLVLFCARCFGVFGPFFSAA